jgi:hypothetical protein
LVCWTTEWPKEKGEKDQQRSTKHTHKTQDRVTRTPLIIWGEPGAPKWFLRRCDCWWHLMASRITVLTASSFYKYTHNPCKWTLYNSLYSTYISICGDLIVQEKGEKDQQRSTKHTHKTQDRVTRTPLIIWGEPGAPKW